MPTMIVPDRLVVLTFDDGAKSDIETVAPLLKSYGFGATFFITEGLNFLANKEHRLTWDEVRALHEDRFEIGNHTSDHAAADVQPPDELQADVGETVTPGGIGGDAAPPNTRSRGGRGGGARPASAAARASGRAAIGG